MRRSWAPLLIASALALGACDDGASEPDPTGGAGPVEVDDIDEETASDGAGSTAEDEPEPGDAADATETDTDSGATDEIPGGEEGQAAADRARRFLLAMVQAEPGTCDYLVSFGDPALPMTDAPEDLELCRAQLPVTMESSVEAQGLTDEDVAGLEQLEIRGAELQGEGDTAVVGPDHYVGPSAGMMDDAPITLRKLDGQWYVDLENSFSTQ